LKMLKYEGMKPVNLREFERETGISEEELVKITKRL